MENSEILLVVDVVSNEKEIDKEIIFEAIEAAMAAATAKRQEVGVDVKVRIDRTTGDYLTFRTWTVVESDEEFEGGLEFSASQILLEDARKIQSDIEVGGIIEESIESIVYGRIAAQTAKQVIVQKVREAERRKVVDAYQERIGELVTGIVKRAERGQVIMDLGGNAEAIISRDDMIPLESIRSGDRIRGYL
ncbi:MAG: transcription termination/antitermination protein NusA, partial [Methylococcus sp.]